MQLVNPRLELLQIISDSPAILVSRGRLVETESVVASGILGCLDQHSQVAFLVEGMVSSLLQSHGILQGFQLLRLLVLF